MFLFIWNNKKKTEKLKNHLINLITRRQDICGRDGCLSHVSALPQVFYFRNPFTICSSASCSVSPKVISLISCSPAILPMAAS